jgi:hypothetical protein
MGIIGIWGLALCDALALELGGQGWCISLFASSQVSPWFVASLFGKLKSWPKGWPIRGLGGKGSKLDFLIRQLQI